jgi:hypothetical protein
VQAGSIELITSVNDEGHVPIAIFLASEAAGQGRRW